MSRYFAPILATVCLLSLSAMRSAQATIVQVEAGYVVVADDGHCSLLEAIDLAKGGTADDCVAQDDGEFFIGTVVLPSNSTFTLTDAGGGSNGLPIYVPDSYSLIIKAADNGATITRSTAIGTPEFRLVNFTGNALELDNLTLSNGQIGSGNGGCIFMQANELILEHVTVSQCHAARAGAIENNGGNLTIRNGSVISHNSADNAVGGIENSGTMTITDSTISDNTSQYFGAGILSQGTATITDSLISGNVAHSDSAPDSAIGGGIYSGGTLTITDTAISGNRAHEGGGLYVIDGTVQIVASVVSGNAGGHEGGGLFMKSGSAQAFDTTIANNVAGASGNGGLGAGIRLLGADDNKPGLRLSYVTIAGNEVFAFGDIVIDHSVVAPRCIFEGNGSLTSLGYNLDNDDSCGFDQASDHINTDPQLGALADNDGPTPSMMPLPASPLIDAIPAADCAVDVPVGVGIDVSHDQRGSARPVGIGCDIGAVEAPQLIANLDRLGGIGQHTLSGDPFLYPLVVQALDTRGNAVPGATIAWEAPATGASAICMPGTTDATGVSFTYCRANFIDGGPYPVDLDAADGFGVEGTDLVQTFNLTNDHSNDRIFGNGFENFAPAMMILARGQITANYAIDVPHGLLAGRIVPILLVKDRDGHRVALVEARCDANGLRLRVITYDARGWPGSIGAWQLPPVARSSLYLTRDASGTDAHLR